MSDPRPLTTEEQRERVRELAAYGPLGRRLVDYELDVLGWTERYDGDPGATDLTDAGHGVIRTQHRV